MADLDDLTTNVTNNSTDIAALNTSISKLEANLTNYVLATDYNQRVSNIEDDIVLLKDAMTWKAMIEE